jgi:hypothetical protein
LTSSCQADLCEERWISFATVQERFTSFGVVIEDEMREDFPLLGKLKSLFRK